MSTLMDHRLGYKKETTYGVAVVPNRFSPLLEVKTEWDPRPRQGKGIVAGGRRSDLGARRFLPNGQGTVTTKVELESKQAGVLLDLAFGTSTVTAITGPPAGSQQNFHPGITGTTLGSATIQVVKVRNDGTDFVETYAGCTASKVTLEQPEDDIATLEIEWDALSYTTATAAAVTSYATAPVLFDAFQATAGLGGTLTAPTTTTLATGLTVFNSFRSWKLELDHKLDTGRWNISSAPRLQPLAGGPEYKFSAKVEYSETTFADALRLGTLLPWYQTWTTTEALAAGFTQLQVVVPQLAISKANVEAKIGDTTMVSVDAMVTNNGSLQDLYVVYRTTDATL